MCNYFCTSSHAAQRLHDAIVIIQKRNEISIEVEEENEITLSSPNSSQLIGGISGDLKAEKYLSKKGIKNSLILKEFDYENQGFRGLDKYIKKKKMKVR